MKKIYEIRFNTLDKNGDVDNCEFYDCKKYTALQAFADITENLGYAASEYDITWNIELSLRYEEDDSTFALLTLEGLDSEFDNGDSIPKKFKAQFASVAKRLQAVERVVVQTVEGQKEIVVPAGISKEAKENPIQYVPVGTLLFSEGEVVRKITEYKPVNGRGSVVVQELSGRVKKVCVVESYSLSIDDVISTSKYDKVGKNPIYRKDLEKQLQKWIDLHSPEPTDPEPPKKAEPTQDTFEDVEDVEESFNAEERHYESFDLFPLVVRDRYSEKKHVFMFCKDGIFYNQADSEGRYFYETFKRVYSTFGYQYELNEAISRFASYEMNQAYLSLGLGSEYTAAVMDLILNQELFDLTEYNAEMTLPRSERVNFNMEIKTVQLLEEINQRFNLKNIMKKQDSFWFENFQTIVDIQGAFTLSFSDEVLVGMNATMKGVFVE